jgi:8-hydroxy-5-deazaflavin:NADPH oxidoreductase
MKLAVLGTGMVGETIGSKLVELGHCLMMGSRTSDNEKAKMFVTKHNSKASAGNFTDAAAFGEIIFNFAQLTMVCLILKSSVSFK